MQREILTYLQYNYTDPLRLETLAEQFHLSEKYLSRYFKQHFHLTLTQYLMHLRLTHACHLLENLSAGYRGCPAVRLPQCKSFYP